MTSHRKKLRADANYVVAEIHRGLGKSLSFFLLFFLPSWCANWGKMLIWLLSQARQIVQISMGAVGGFYDKRVEKDVDHHPSSQTEGYGD